METHTREVETSYPFFLLAKLKKLEGEMTDGPFLSGLEQMETNSHLSGWEVTITTASVRDAPMPHRSATTDILTYIRHQWELWNPLKLGPWNWGLYHNPAFTRWVPNFTLCAPPLQPNWVDVIKVRLVWKGGRNSQQFLPSPVNLQSAHLALSSLAQHVHTC